MMRGLVLGLVVLLAAAPVFAQENERERILSYDSDITVNADASLLVRETIRVYVLGVNIKHGIFRDFPTNYKAPWMSRFTTTFELEDVTLDGAPVPHREETKTNGVRTYIGDPDAFVSRGEHTYSIVYRTRHQLAYWDDHDELYWNVTGNGWSFPIESVEARVRLPRAVAAEQLQLNGFTGPEGSTEGAYESFVDPNGEIVFRATRSLQDLEGFTISTIFPTGLVTRPSVAEDLAKWAADNYALRVGLVGTVLTFAYFVYAWFLVGRDPAAGDFRARSEPPRGYSPAAARYLSRMGFDNQAFAAALVSLAVKKHIKISQTDKHFSVKRLDASDADCSLEEKAVLKALLSKGDSITFKQSNHVRIGKAINLCHEALRKEYEKRYFLTNAIYAFPGTLLAMGTIGLALYFSPHQSDAPVLFLGIWFTFWSFGCLLLAHAVVAAWRSAFKGVGQFVGALFITGFATPFFAAEIIVMVVLFGGSAIWVLPLIAVLATMNWVFYQLMKAPTKLGRRALDEIDGYRAYLDGGRTLPQSASMSTPDASMFNEYFPYAMALDLDEEWADRFAADIASAATDDSRYNAYRPYWYHGDMWDRHGMHGFSRSIGSAMSSEISSSSTAPGTSSGGSSGGSSVGSSGGGGGGGGGGGW